MYLVGGFIKIEFCGYIYLEIICVIVLELEYTKSVDLKE